MKSRLGVTVAAWVGLLVVSAMADRVAAQPLPLSEPEAIGFSKQGLARLDAMFGREIEAKRLPGAVVAIARDGKLAHYKAYGFLDAEKRTPMPLDAIFALASMTKIMTSVAALQLTEDGRLPLKSRVSDYYPAFADMKVGVADGDALKLVALARPITVHDLFRHTSGLTYGGRGDHPIAKHYPNGIQPAFENTTVEFIERIAKLPLAHQPGAAFEYSFSTDVLGAVVEKVAGKRLGEVLQAGVWTPLAMTDATFAVADGKRARLAEPLANNPIDGKPQSIPVNRQSTKFDCGGACAFATVGDYVRFGQMLVSGGELDGKRVLAPKTVALMTANHLGPEIKNNALGGVAQREGFGFGLGVATRMEGGIAPVPGSVGEFGWNGAFGTTFFADPKERLVVVIGMATMGEVARAQREQIQAIIYGAMTR